MLWLRDVVSIVYSLSPTATLSPCLTKTSLTVPLTGIVRFWNFVGWTVAVPVMIVEMELFFVEPV